jgi:hypothetical protein
MRCCVSYPRLFSALLHGVLPERISVITGQPHDAAEHDQEVKAGEAAGAVAPGGGVALAGLTAFANLLLVRSSQLERRRPRWAQR